MNIFFQFLGISFVTILVSTMSKKTQLDFEHSLSGRYRSVIPTLREYQEANYY